MVLVSATGFPHGQFNHEAIGATTEAQCKYTCLMNYRTCKAVSWLPRPTEPCVHYQTLTDDKVSPLTGCRYWKVVHNDTTTVAAAAQHFKALSPIYPLVAAISNKNNHAWDVRKQGHARARTQSLSHFQFHLVADSRYRLDWTRLDWTGL
jgi:hypothetical protein